MGRTGSGVEVRARSIRLSFVFEGETRRPTLMLNGAPMLPTPPNIKYAHRLAVEVRDRIRHGTFSMAEYFPAAGTGAAPLTVAAQLDAWIAAQRIESSTRDGYTSAIKFWKAAPADLSLSPVGSLPLRALKASHLQHAIASRPDLSGKTVNNYVSVIREAVELAVVDRVLDENAVKHVPRAKYQKPQPDPFTRDEAEAIIADVRARQPEPIANLIEWWFFSGPRTSEVAGLRWPQVGLAAGTMQIREATVRGIEKQRTKTHVARDVHLNSRALAAITRQKAHTLLAGDHVWLDPRYGTPWHEERAFRRSYWTPTLKRLGIRYRRPYNMRHTYASLMLMAGMAPGYCARQMGHSVEVFLSTYAKWTPGAGDAVEMAKLERSLRPLSSPETPQESTS